MNTTFQFYIFELVLVSILLWKSNFEFLVGISPKRVFPVKQEKVNITIEFCTFELILILFLKKRILPMKNRKMNITIEFFIFVLVKVPNFNLNWNFDFLDQIFPKRMFGVKNGKIEHHHWILHIQISCTLFSTRCHNSSKQPQLWKTEAATKNFSSM